MLCCLSCGVMKAGKTRVKVNFPPHPSATLEPPFAPSSLQQKDSALCLWLGLTPPPILSVSPSLLTPSHIKAGGDVGVGIGEDGVIYCVPNRIIIPGVYFLCE